MAKKSFEKWYAELKELAKKNDLEWLIPPIEDYPRDAYEDDMTIAETLSEEWDCAQQDAEF